MIELVLYQWILLALFDTVTSQLADCSYFRNKWAAIPVGSQFCNSDEYTDAQYINETESWYFLCENDIPYRYSFRTTNCTGNHTKDIATEYYNNYGSYNVDYQCNDKTCDYIYYSLLTGPSYGCDDDIDSNYTVYRVTDHCTDGTDLYTGNSSEITPLYFSWQCDANTLYHRNHPSNDCSGFFQIAEEVHSSFCFEIHQCSNSLSQCANIEIDERYHIGDIIEDTVDIIDDICNSPGGIMLGMVLGPIGMVCDGVGMLGAVCNLFDISGCAEQHDTIVASCWSSNTFSYGNVSTLDAFQRYIGEEYNITARYESTTNVEAEAYKQTEVYLENCGGLENYWIGGVYDSHDNGEQNDVVSDVVEYLVNQGIAESENAPGGVSSHDQQEQLGVKFTDVVRSKRGLLLHYDEMDYLETNYGIYFCEFNVVVGGSDDDNIDATTEKFNFSVQFALFVLFLFCGC